MRSTVEGAAAASIDGVWREEERLSLTRRQPPPPPSAVTLPRVAGEDARGDDASPPDDDLDAASEKGPERTCVVTRRKGAPATMIRFVVGPDGGVVPDIRAKLPGRGVWVDGRTDLVATAVRKGAFARGFKAKVAAAPTLADDVDALLEHDALQSLAMANKAGAVTTGFAKVEAAVAKGGLAALLHSSDAGADGVRKLEGARRAAPGRTIVAFKVFSSQQLDLALGRTNVIHAALTAGTASQAFLTRCRRLMAYRLAAIDDDSGGATAAPV